MKKYDDNIEKALKDAELDDILDSFSSSKSTDKNNQNSPEELEPPVRRTNEEEAPIQPEPKQEEKNKAKKKSKAKPIIIKVILGVVAVLVVVGIVFGVVSYSQTAYLKPYIEKYNVDFPKGIAEEFCDAYGENQKVVGKVEIKDLDAEFYVSSESDSFNPHFDSDIQSTDDEQPTQFRSISMYSTTADIENAYSDVEKYNSSSQEVVYTDYYGNSDKYQVVAAYYVNVDPKDDNDYAFPFKVNGTLTEDSFDGYEDRIQTRSLYVTGHDILYNAQYLTISADCEFMDDFRFVILCVKVDGDITPITDATPNKKIHYPQIWYDENNEHNPYWLAGKWQPEYK